MIDAASAARRRLRCGLAIVSTVITTISLGSTLVSTVCSLLLQRHYDTVRYIRYRIESVFATRVRSDGDGRFVTNHVRDCIQRMLWHVHVFYYEMSFLGPTNDLPLLFCV